MIYFYPRNPYRYATAGHFIKKVPNRMTKGQRWVCGLVWLAALISMVILYIQRFGMPF